MFTFRTMTALGLFLFGTTFLWLTPAFQGARREGGGIAWAAVQVLVMAAVIGFAVAAWGVFKATTWWEPVAITSAIVGLVVLVPYWAGVHNMMGVANVGSNIAIHAGGSVAIVLLLTVPLLHQWLASRL